MNNVTESTRHDISRKISIVSVIGMICVVMWHSQTCNTLKEPAIWNVFVQNLFFVGWAVPWFFMVSGYFFHKSLSRDDSPFVILRRKLRTLVLPYFIWATLGLVFTTPVVVLTNILMHHGNVLSRTAFEKMSFCGVLETGYGLNFLAGPSGDGALWYIRDLMVLFIFVPLWKWIYRWRYSFIVVSLIFFIFSWIADVGSISGRIFSAAAWFTFGIFVAECGLEKQIISKKVVILSGLIAFIGFTLRAAYISGLISFQIPQIIMSIIIFFMMLFLWGAIGSLSIHQFDTEPRRVCLFTFWIYVSHTIWLFWFLNIGNYFSGQNNIVRFILFIVNPPLAITACMFIGLLIKKHYPIFYGILSGSR